MRFGMGIRVSTSLPVFVENVKLMEREGFDSVQIADFGRHRDIFVAATLAGLGTKSIRIGLFSIPYIRHPVVISSGAATVDEASNGRAFIVLGLGGFNALRPLGIKTWEHPLTTLKETVMILRELHSGGSADFNGKMFSPQGVKLEFAARKDIPIYIACMAGNKMLQLAGKIADGVLLAGPYGEYTRNIIERVKRSAIENGRNPNELEIAMNTVFLVGRDREKAINTVKPFIASEIVLDPRLRPAVEAENVNIEKVKKEVRKGKSGADLIKDEVADAFAMVGDVDHCIEKIKELSKVGVKQINPFIPWTFSNRQQYELDMIKTMGRHIIPVFRQTSET